MHHLLIPGGVATLGQGDQALGVTSHGQGLGPCRADAIVLEELSDRDSVLKDAPVNLTWTFADHSANDNQRRNRTVDRAVARLFAAIAQREAVEANRAGDYQGARRILEKTARRIEGYAGDDLELQQIGQELRGLFEEFAHVMDAVSLKQRHYSSYAAARSRTVEGKARKY